MANLAAKIGKKIGKDTASLAGHKTEQLIGTAKGIDNLLFKKVGLDQRTFGRKLRPTAFGLFVGGSAVVGAASGVKEMNEAQMGAKDPNIYRATPTVPSYVDSGEATGDLVFALHDLRRG